MVGWSRLKDFDLTSCSNSLLGLLGVATDVGRLESSPSDAEAELGVFCLRLSKGAVLSTRGIARISGFALAHIGNGKVIGPIISHAFSSFLESSRPDLSSGSILSVSIRVRFSSS